MIFSVFIKNNYRQWNFSFYRVQAIAVLFILFLFVLSCKEKLTEHEIKEYIKNPANGLIKNKEIRNVKYTVSYKPTSLLINQELKREIGDITSLEQKYTKNHYFNVAVSENNVEVLNNAVKNKEKYKSTLFTLLNNMSQHVYLLNDKLDTLRLIDYIYPRTYGHSSSTNMMFVFEKKKWNNTKWVRLQINEFGLNTGNTKYKFLKQDIKNIPQLKINEQYEN